MNSLFRKLRKIRSHLKALMFVYTNLNLMLFNIFKDMNSCVK